LHGHNYISCPETNTYPEMGKVCLFLKDNEGEALNYYLTPEYEQYKYLFAFY